MSALTTTVLTRRFGDLTAVDQLSLDLPTGGVTGLREQVLDHMRQCRSPVGNHFDRIDVAAFHSTGQYENNRVECDQVRLKARLRPMRGLKTHRSASLVIRGHALVQNLRRGHCELGTEVAPALRLAAAFDDLQPAI